MAQPNHRHIKEIKQFLESVDLNEKIKVCQQDLSSQIKDDGLYGIQLVAFDHQYLVYGLHLAQRIKNSSGVAVSMVTNASGIDIDKAKAYFGLNALVVVDVPSYMDRCFKINVDKFSPFEKTFFLDSDILPVSSVQDIFTYLEGADVALVVAQSGLGSDYPEAIGRICEGREVFAEFKAGSIFFGGGVFGWKKSDKSTRFFDLWRDSYLKNLAFNKFTGDQIALNSARVLFEEEITFVPPNWNYRESHLEPKNQRLWHFNSSRLSRNLLHRIKIFCMLLDGGKNLSKFLRVSGQRKGFFLLRGVYRIFQKTFLFG
jgi:hypothetical protein